MREKSKLRLNARQRQAAILLAEGHDTVSSIAKKLGVDRTTLYNWKNRPDFQALTNQIQQDVVAAANAMLTSLFVEALRAQAQLLKSKNERIRLAATKMILDRLPGSEIGPCTAEEIIAQKGGITPAYRDPRRMYEIRKVLGFKDPDPDLSVEPAETDVSDAGTDGAKS